MRANTNVVITEIGGTTGDIEGCHSWRHPPNHSRSGSRKCGQTCTLHSCLTSSCARTKNETPNKASQSCARLVAATGLDFGRKKAAGPRCATKNCRCLQCFGKAVIEARRMSRHCLRISIDVARRGTRQTSCHLLHLETPEPDLADWRKFVERVVSPKSVLR